MRIHVFHPFSFSSPLVIQPPFGVFSNSLSPAVPIQSTFGLISHRNSGEPLHPGGKVGRLNSPPFNAKRSMAEIKWFILMTIPSLLFENVRLSYSEIREQRHLDSPTLLKDTFTMESHDPKSSIGMGALS
jgi:hypothetical protein